MQSRNERMFLLTFLVLNTADNPRQLGNNIFQAGSIAQKYNCQLTRLDFQQEEGLMSCLPLGLNQIEIQRGLTTSSTAIFVPFTTQELFQNGKEALYYGINALSNNLIMVDRKLLKNPNGLILGTPGSGKSFSAKREIANCFLLTNDDVIICDPEAEYAPLVERLHGQVIKISPTSTNYINPMDLNLDYSDDESPLSLKSDFILSLCELIVGEQMEDPHNVEHGGTMRGMGLLNTRTVFSEAKTRTQIRGVMEKGVGLWSNWQGKKVTGYEIHMGVTENLGGCQELVRLEDGRVDALANEDGSVMGSYLHGIFDTDGFAEEMIRRLMKEKGMEFENWHFDLEAHKEQEYDKLADLVRSSFDMKKIYEILEGGI